ncbi:MAG TPA: tyrosine-type recombinase/integrase [Caulobacteraceae bacterium]|jgi:integrase|nr:tyrosine-type recombinase/integrase [Caulobacteraceae bacterium]
MASIRKRTWTNGKGDHTAWIADYFDQDGERHIKTFSTKKAADAWLVSARGEVSRGVHTAESASITVAEAADLWIKTGELEKLERSTLRQYRTHADLHIKPLIGGEKLARLSSPAIEAFRDELMKKGSRAMARKVLTSLKSILREAQRRGLVAQNVAQPLKVDVKKRDQRKITAGRDFPSKEEAQAILAGAGGRWRPLLVVAVFTGMRASELRGLTWDAVDFDRNVVSVRQRANLWGEIGSPKSAAGERDIPMSPMVVNALKKWRLACPRFKPPGNEGESRLWLVFPNGNGKVESHTNIANRGFGPLQIAAGMVDGDGSAKYGLHALRHFFASWAIERGFSPKRLQALLGHSSIQITFDVYGHLFPSLEDDHAKFAAGERALIG